MPDAFARLLSRLITEGSLPRSQFSTRSLKGLSSLFDAGVLRKTRRGGGLVVEVQNDGALKVFYQNRYPSSGQLIDGPPRARAVGMLRNAKRTSHTDMEPVILRAMKSVVSIRDGAQCDLQEITRQTGAACLILELGRFWSLSANIAVVENLECFLHFEDMPVVADVALYAAGRLSDLVLRWFSSEQLSQCQFIHCGDYDPVGLDEYLRLKAVVRDRARLYIPANLRELIAEYGRPELLRSSQAPFKRLHDTSDQEVRKVVALLDETGCGLEQEILLIKN